MFASFALGRMLAELDMLFAVFVNPIKAQPANL
jgi:hypothetical protein